MPFFQLSPEELRVGQPVPFSLLDANGHLLMARGVVIQSVAHHQHLFARGVYVDVQDSAEYRRAMAEKLDSMLRENETLGRIAKARLDGSVVEGASLLRKSVDPLVAVGDLQMHAGKLLREAPQADFAQRLDKLLGELSALLSGDPDVALLILVVTAASELRQYSATHSMLVAVVCDLAARQMPEWPDDWHLPLRGAALTMNLAMTTLQDTLAQQALPPSPQQRAVIDNHAHRTAQALIDAGVRDSMWIEAVRHHHSSPPGSLASLPAASQLARTIQRADIFAARLSPRIKRAALSGAAAAGAAYLDENRRPDEAGAAIIKATGIYPPGSYVRLECGETAVVLRRGNRANEPLVASVLGRSGTPLGEPALRNTRMPKFGVIAGVAPHEVRLRLNLEKLLRLL